ncbi:hypothetical protein D9M69_526160 [compost metagenome]
MRGDVLEQVGRGGQVVHLDPFARRQALGQAAKVGALRDVHGEVVEALGEALPGGDVEVDPGDLGTAAAFGEGLVGGALERLAGEREDARLRVQATVAVQVIEGGQQLVQGQVAGTAEDQHVAGNGQDIPPDSRSITMGHVFHRLQKRFS